MLYESETDPNSLYYIRDCYEYSQSKFNGLVCLQLNKSLLLQSFDYFTKYSGALCLLYNSEGNIILSNNTTLRNNNIATLQYHNKNIKEILTDTDNYIIRTNELGTYRMTSTIIIPKKPIQEGLKAQLKLYLYIFIALTIVFILLALLLSRIITKYIDLLIKRMSAIRQGDYEHTIPEYGIAEIDKLNKAFCDMSTEIEQLLNKIYANEILLKESELKARFGDKLQFGIKIPEELLGHNIIKLIIQPVVENAIVHGIESKLSVGNVSIVASTSNDKIYITVTDDGIGFDMTSIHFDEQRIIHSAAISTGNPNGNITSHHIALLNTHQRLKYVFGDEYGLTIVSKINQGTTVSICCTFNP